MKLKLIYSMFRTLHTDLRFIYNVLVISGFDGDKRSDRIKQAMSDFDSSYNYTVADIEEEIAKKKED